VVTDPVEAKKLFRMALALTPDFMPVEAAMQQTATGLEALAKEAAKAWNGRA
jgi:hypothetical protein